MLLYMFGSAMCSFIEFLSRTECHASRISLCRHVGDLSTILTLSKKGHPTDRFGGISVRKTCNRLKFSVRELSSRAFLIKIN